MTRPLGALTPPADALVSSIGQGIRSWGQYKAYSQVFTTGSNESGYTLTGVDVASASSTAFTAEVCGVTSTLGPTTTCTVLTGPGSFAVGAVSFAAPGNTVLVKDTTYAVVVTSTGADDTQGWGETLADGEDAGSAAGWSIQNNGRYRHPSHSSSDWSQSTGAVLRMAVRSSAGGSTPAAPTNFIAGVGDTEVTLSWDAPASGSGVTRHEYRYKTTGKYTPWTRIPDSGPGEANARGFTVTELRNGREHVFELRAGGPDGKSEAATVKATPEDPPRIASVAVTSGPGLEADTYGAGEGIRITVTFDQPVLVEGDPEFRLRVGGESRVAEYESGSGTEELVFVYRVRPGDSDGDGISIGTRALRLDGDDSIGNAAGEAAELDHDELGTQARLAGQALPSWDAANGRAKAAANDDAGADASARARDRGLAVDARDREAVAAIRDWMAHAGANDDWRAWDGNPEGADRVRSRALTGRDFVTGTSFALTGGSAEAGGYAALWGRGAISRFDGREGELTLDGEVPTGLMGADLPPELRRPHDYHAAHPTPIPLRAAPGTPSPP